MCNNLCLPLHFQLHLSLMFIVVVHICCLIHSRFALQHPSGFNFFQQVPSHQIWSKRVERRVLIFVNEFNRLHFSENIPRLQHLIYLN